MDPADLVTGVEGDLQNTVVLEPGFKARDTTFARKPTAPNDSLSRWEVPTPSNRPGASSSKKRRLQDEFNRDENEDDAGNYAKPPPSGQAGARGQKFACPFRKHDPVAYCLADHTICAASSWPSTARLKEHLYRCHMPIFCPRCKALFRTKPALDKHLMIAVADVCEVRDCPPPAGITIEQEKELKSRKKSSPGQSEEDKWNNIYSLLFPTEATPSCYFEPIREPGRYSHGADDLDGLECYLRCRVPQLVSTTLDEKARQHQRPLQAQMLGIIHEITQDCVEQACREFKRCRGTEPNHVVPKQQELKTRSDAVQEAHADPLRLLEESGSSLQNFEAQDQFAGIIFEDCNHESTQFSENITRTPQQVDGRFEQVDTTRQQLRIGDAVSTNASNSGHCAFCYNSHEGSCVFDFDPALFMKTI
ncbi:uncharacterized protein E0L32_003981 [Thyridium curvatum]|uniref:C2H2-type domain-containing protein n=1 Tax=Thyridium curvatum TaxID=1093900 RepID=A0A507B226_9PEZI|nr:uncharacterized protein E0L32_003981 [Thyridium curvatum]TPX16332.1 hypothetical protein E0L32_003981 [Thyridium curvatum]